MARLKPSAISHHATKSVPKDTNSLSSNPKKMARPAVPRAVPRAKIFRSCVRFARKRLPRRNGKAVMPPRAMKFPAANGEKRRLLESAPNTGIFD